MGARKPASHYAHIDIKEFAYRLLIGRPVPGMNGRIIGEYVLGSGNGKSHRHLGNPPAEHTRTGNYTYPFGIKFIRYDAFHAARRMSHQFQFRRIAQKRIRKLRCSPGRDSDVGPF